MLVPFAYCVESVKSELLVRINDNIHRENRKVE